MTTDRAAEERLDVGGRIAVAVLVIGILIGLIACFINPTPARAQVALPVVPLGYCQIATLSSSVQITASSCVGASFTATGSGTNLTTSSVTGAIKVGAALAGTGVPAGTYIVSQTSGTAGGAGVYVTSVATTSSAASLTSGGVPQGATQAHIEAEGKDVRYRDDGAAPTASVGQVIPLGTSILYSGTATALRFIETANPAKLNISFYR